MLCTQVSFLKGEVRRFFLYWLKVFIGPKLRQVSKGNFHRKAPKWVKNQVKGSKIDQIRTKWHPTCWGNPPILSSELLRESINSVIQPTEGIHTSIYFWLPTSEITKKSPKTDHSIAIYYNFWIGMLYFGNHLMNPRVQVVQNMYGKGGKGVCKADLQPPEVDPYFERKKSPRAVLEKLGRPQFWL